MANRPRKNAIERRVDRLGELWSEFAQEPDARLLRWLVSSDEPQVVLGFIEQQRSGAGELPDLFVRLDTPFKGSPDYGFALREEVLKLYAELKADEDLNKELAADNIALDWTCPATDPGGSDVFAFVQCCASFRKHHEGTMLHLAIALVPDRISDSAAWRTWLHALVRSEVPANVRVMVLDRAEAPVLDELAKAEPQLVRTIAPELDMLRAVQEVLREAGGSGPGVSFRSHFIALTEAAAKGDLARAEHLHAGALSIAAEHNWPHLQVVIHLALGSAYLGAGRAADALATYRRAAQAAAEATSQGNPAGPKLVVQAWLSAAAALLRDGLYSDAVKLYRASAAGAAEQSDHLMTLESWRMAAYCHEMTGDIDAAWQCGWNALDAGARLDDQLRMNSTLPYVGQGLLRVTQRSSHADKTEDVRRRMVALIGPDWEGKIEEIESASP